MLQTTRITAHVIGKVNELIKDTCKVERCFYVSNDNITHANLFKDGLNLLDNGKKILADNFVFNVNKNFFNASHISSHCAPDGSVDTSFKNDGAEDQSPDFEKLKEAGLNYPKNPLIAYLNINSLRNKIIDLGDIMSYLSPDYLVLSETKLDDSFPSAQFSIPDYEIRARRDRHKNGGGLIEFVKKGLICKRLKNFETSASECIWSEITVSKRKWLCFSIYRPPYNENLDIFFEELTNSLSKASESYELHYHGTSI